MKLFKVLLCAYIVGQAASRPADMSTWNGSSGPASLVKRQQKLLDDGQGYHVKTATEHQGTARSGQKLALTDPALAWKEILNYDADTHTRLEAGNPGVAVRGEYRFVDQGKEYKVVYVADHEGFRAQTDEVGVVSDSSAKESGKSDSQLSPSGKTASTEVSTKDGSKQSTEPIRKSIAVPIEILSYDADTHSRVESGQPGIAVSGEYKFTNDDKEYKVTYVADEQGFRAQGDHIPLAVPVITKSSNVQATHKAALIPSGSPSQSVAQKTSSDSVEILNYDAETHSRVETGQPGVAVSGEYKFTNDDKQYKVTYVADEQGFRAQGDHIPVAVPVITQSSNVQATHKATLIPSGSPSQSVAQKTFSDSVEILNYDAETHSRVETGQPGVAVSGEYKFTNDDKEYKVTYVADEQGFRAQGDHIPVAVPAVIRSSNVQPDQKASLVPSATYSQSAVQKTSSGPIEILNYDAETHTRQESGEPGVAVKGQFTFTNDNKDYKVVYIADENGFRAEGEHIPVLPVGFFKSALQGPASLGPSETAADYSSQRISAVPLEILNYDADSHSRQEEGIPGVAVKGGYKYSSEGKEYVVAYIADDQGFRIESQNVANLPQSAAAFSKVATQQNQLQDEEITTTPPPPPPQPPVEPIVLEEIFPPIEPVVEGTNSLPAVKVVPDSGAPSAEKGQHDSANCDQLAKSVAPIAAPAYFVPVHFPSVHPFGYYIVQVKAAE